MKFPSSVLISVLLYVAEAVFALYLSFTYSSAGERVWFSLTLLFFLLPCVLVQICFICIHGESYGDKPLEHLFHFLQLGHLARCVQAFSIYFINGKSEAPYTNIRKRKQLSDDGGCVEVEKEIGRAEMLLSTHSSAFGWAAFIQAFLGSAPQLMLQLYITISQQHIDLYRCVLMSISLLSVAYGALQCNILAITIKYDDYDVTFKPAAYLCIFLWRFFEISTRIIVLGLSISVFKIWTLCLVTVTILCFFVYQWIALWIIKLPEDKDFNKCRTAVERWTLAILYSITSMFCWCAIQVELSEPDLTTKSYNWFHIIAYYILRFTENAVLFFVWYFLQTDAFSLLQVHVLVFLLLVGYAMSVLFMLLFHLRCHPLRVIFTSSFTGGLMSCRKCFCCMCKHSRDPKKENVEHYQ